MFPLETIFFTVANPNSNMGGLRQARIPGLEANLNTGVYCVWKIRIRIAIRVVTAAMMAVTMTGMMIVDVK
jgi:hypothetical protein